MSKVFIKKTIVYLLVSILLVGAIVTTVLLLGKEKHKDSNKLVVYTSMFAMYDFAKQIGKDKVEVYNLVEQGAEAHGYTPTTEDMKNLVGADLIIVNGGGMESWIEDLDSEISGKIVNASTGITLLEKDNTDNHNHDEEDHDHDEEDHDEEHDHDHGHGHNHTHDPHTWLSLKNAVKQIENIKNAFAEKDASNKDYYNANYEAYNYQLMGLDYMYQTQLADLTSRTIVVSHKAFGYISHDYNLTQLALSGIDHESEPDANTMAKIIATISNPDNNIKAIFSQTNANAKVVESIANLNNVNVKVLKLHTAESLTSNQMESGLTYLDIMSQNLYNLVVGLK